MSPLGTILSLALAVALVAAFGLACWLLIWNDENPQDPPLARR